MGFCHHSVWTMIVRFQPVMNTFAELHERLGFVPLERIRLHPAPGTATEADLLEIRKPLCELIDGVLVEKAMGFKEGFLAGEILRWIGNFLQTVPLGIVAPGDSPIRFAPGLVRIPDVCFIPWEHLPDDEVSDEPIPATIPALAVEVLSESNTPAEMTRKVREYFDADVKLVWLIDPREKSARVYTSPKRVKVIDESGSLDGAKVLPGFKLPLAELFAATKKPKKRGR